MLSPILSVTSSPMTVSPGGSSPAETWASARRWASACSSASMGHESTLLVTAVLSGDVGQVQTLINVGVGISDHHHWVLYHACLQGLDMVQALLACSAINFNANLPDEGGD